MPKDAPAELHLPIGVVERETGLPKDTLRVWERRYGFPSPLRDALGERLYSPAEVDKLRLIKRLIDQGMRPSKLILSSSAELSRMLVTRPDIGTEHPCDALLQKVHIENISELRTILTQKLMQQGVLRFICDTLTPLNRRVGEAWLNGKIQIFEEHLYSELVANLLRASIGAYLGRGGTPRVLLTTIPEEEHGLGLLMAEAVMTAEGAECTSLGIRTPLNDICEAARLGGFDAVALSFSARCSVRLVTDSLNSLRARLPDSIALWAGGSGLRAQERLAAGIEVIHSIEGIAQHLHQWRERA
jgi:DNA-binding transcriptional MerR regulator/methylmalonyl-CoA mutase cobalamin-binding subunit